VANPKTVPAFKKSYTLLVRDTGQIYEGDSVFSVLRQIKYSLPKKGGADLFANDSTLLQKYDKNGFHHKEKPYCLRDHLGGYVPESVIFEALRELRNKTISDRDIWRAMRFAERDRRDNMLDARLLRPNGNPYKIKGSYAKKPYLQKRFPSFMSGYGFVNGYSYAQNVGMFRCPKTRHETTKNIGHSDRELHEYGKNLVRARRMSLPTAWDDFLKTSRSSEKSWKHHSKRKKQWKPV